jgi:copper homeostasis protein
MPRPIIFELCAETIEACSAADAGGADRIELCSNLKEDGLTPDFALLRHAVELCRLPLHVMLRPRSRDFLYSTEEFELICEQLEQARTLGASGFVCGILLPDRAVDVPRMSQPTALAEPLPVTFHRAFDTTLNLSQSLEDVIASGCRRVLTSGGEPVALAGANALAELVTQAGDRIEVAVGRGLRLDNAATLARSTGASHFHGTLRAPESDVVNPDYVRAVITALREA